MNSARSRLVAAAAFALLLAGCEQQQGAAQTEVPEPAPPSTIATLTEPAAPLPEPSAPIPLATELPVNAVDSVMLSRPDDAPSGLIIRVLGTAASGGWSLPKLEPVEDEASTDASIMSYQFVATSPESTGDTNTAAEQIVVELRVESLPPDVMAIRIVSATNEISAPVAQ
jgi:hypothetical protein